MCAQQGPCVSTDTACSSSLVAAHLAAQGLAAAAGSGGSGGGGGAALAGGVNVMLLAQTTARICLLQVGSFLAAWSRWMGTYAHK